MAKLEKIYPFRKNGRFYNCPDEKQCSVFYMAKMYLEALLQGTRCLKKIKRDWVLKKSPFVCYKDHSSYNPRIVWVGHATFVIQISGLTIVTDPIFGEFSSLFKRLVQPGVVLEQLPKIDVVLISHNHRDHMDEKSLRSIVRKNPNVKIFVPEGDKAWFDRKGFDGVTECMWWDGFELESKTGDPVEITFLPARHWSGRGLSDWNRSLWGSWMIESCDHSIYFAGDTAYGNHFKVIASHFPNIDTALMPIGPCEPDHDMRVVSLHSNAEEAGKGFLELKAQRLIPMHWGVYYLGICHPLLPVERLRKWWKNRPKRLVNKSLYFLKFGQSIVCKRIKKIKSYRINKNSWLSRRVRSRRKS